MSMVREVLSCLSKALVTVAVMLSILILAADPALDTPARPLAAVLLALGTIGLLALNSAPDTSGR